MIDQPKIIDGPEGQKLREQTLIEFVAILPESHLARRELAELQRRSSEMFRLSRENEALQGKLVEANENFAMQIRELNGLKTATTTIIPEISSAAEIPSAPPVGEKIPCRFCGKPIAHGKGYWGMHLKSSHPELDSKTNPQIV